MRNSHVSGHDTGHHARAYSGTTQATCIRHTSSIWSPSICLLLVLLLLLLLFLIKVHFCFRLTTGIAILLFDGPPFMKATLIHVCHSRHPTRRVERSMTAPGCTAFVGYLPVGVFFSNEPTPRRYQPFQNRNEQINVPKDLETTDPHCSSRVQ